MGVFMSANLKRSELAATCKEKIESLAAIDRNDLYGEDRLAKLSFDKDARSKDVFEKTLDLFDDLRTCDFSRFSQPMFNGLIGQLNIVSQEFDKAKSLTLDAGNPKAERDAIVTNLDNAYDALFQVASPIISFSTRAGVDFKGLERKAKQTVGSVEAILEKAKKEFEQKNTDIEGILSAMRDSSAEVGVSKNSRFYKESCDSHTGIAEKWLKAIIILASVMCLYIIVCTGVLIRVNNVGQKVQFTYLEAGMLLLFGVLVMALNFSKKQYQSHRHNSIINSDKAKSLGTFMTFVEATESPLVKDVILQYACQSAFCITTSGYDASKERSSQTPWPPSIQMAKSLIDGSSSPNLHH